MSAFFSPFLIRIHEMSLAEAGYAIGAVKGPTGIIGLLAGGLVADRLAKRSLGGGIRIVGGLMVLAAAFAIATVTVPSWTLALAFTGCFNFLNHRSEEQQAELQSLMRLSFHGFCWKKKNN